MVKSLQKLATESCIHGLRYLYDVGEAPYKLLRPVLLKIGDPEQLHEIELKSPQIAKDDEEIWRRFIVRDIPTGDKWLDERDKRIATEDAEDRAEGKEIEQRRPDWWKIYQKLKRKAEKASVDSEAALQAVLNQKRAEKQENATTLGATLKVPQASRQGHSSSSSSKPSSKMSLMDKARKQAREASMGRGLLHTSNGVVKPNPGRTVFQSSSRPPAPASSPATSATSSTPATQSREEAMARREAALRRAEEGRAPMVGFTPVKRPSSNVFVANKRRKR